MQILRHLPSRRVHAAKRNAPPPRRWVPPCFTHPATANPSRGGFTLVELLVAISIFLVVSVMTIGAINLSATSQRVRGAARLVQSKIEGARDRAIYNARQNPTNPRPVGIRLLVDEANDQICTSMVYIESPGKDKSDLANGIGVQVVNPDQFAGPAALIGTGTSWRTLADRGLIGPGSTIKVGRAGGSGEVLDAIHPASFPIKTEGDVFGGNFNGIGGTDELVLFTMRLHPDVPRGASGIPVSNPLTFSIELEPDVMAGEDPLELPRDTCINLVASATTGKFPGGWVTSSTTPAQFSNRMDILFSSNGSVVGNAASTGIINLYLCLRDDAVEGATPGSPTTANDFDGDGQNDKRHGEELGITIFTKAGRTISHPIAPPPANPWEFGLQGEVAR